MAITSVSSCKEGYHLMMLNSFFLQSTFIVLQLNDEKQEFLIAANKKKSRVFVPIKREKGRVLRIPHNRIINTHSTCLISLLFYVCGALKLFFCILKEEKFIQKFNYKMRGLLSGFSIKGATVASDIPRLASHIKAHVNAHDSIDCWICGRYQNCELICCHIHFLDDPVQKILCKVQRWTFLKSKKLKIKIDGKFINLQVLTQTLSLIEKLLKGM